MVMKIISGGQTGADRAGLDAAIAAGIEHGGWVPKGRLTEAGPLPGRYQMQEMATRLYPARTRKNVAESDGTVIFTHGQLTGGSLLTKKEAIRMGKPWVHIDFDQVDPAQAAAQLGDFITAHQVGTLNVAGSRAGKDELIYEKVSASITGMVERLRGEEGGVRQPYSMEFPGGGSQSAEPFAWSWLIAGVGG
jgi:hypothetical protein